MQIVSLGDTLQEMFSGKNCEETICMNGPEKEKKNSSNFQPAEFA